MRRFYQVPVLFCLLLSIVYSAVPAAYGQNIPRISVEETKYRVSSGKALLVCSYSDARCQRVLLKDALLLSQLEEKAKSLSKNSEIIFYCA
jgi:hypothetical protein